MFETICIRNQNEGNNPIDIGFLAEAMLFYQQVRIIGNPGSIGQLVKQCGPETLIELLKSGFLKISYQTMNACVATQALNTNTPNEIHSPGFYSARRFALQTFAPKLFTDVTGRSGKGRRMGNRFIALVDSTPATDQIVGRAFEEGLSSGNYINKAVVKFLSIYVPEYQIPQPFEFQVIKQEKVYSVRTNIDFPRVNYFYHKRVPVAHSTLNAAYILVRLLAVGTAMGVGLSAADAFLVDKIINGWKPNHFVNEHLVNFFNK